MKVPGDVDQPIEVIAVGMRKNQCINGSNFLSPQKRCNNSCTHIKSGVIRESAAIDQHGITPGKFQQRRAAMADIDDRNPEIWVAKPLIHPIACVGCQRNEDQYQGCYCQIALRNPFKLQTPEYVLESTQDGIDTGKRHLKISCDRL